MLQLLEIYRGEDCKGRQDGMRFRRVKNNRLVILIQRLESVMTVQFVIKQAMRLTIICVIIFLFNANSAYSQEESLTYSFEKSFFNNYKPPRELDKDTCITAATFIKLYVNKDFKVSKIEFSDNAGLPYVEELNRKKHLFNTSHIEYYSRKNKVNNFHIIIPVFFEKLAQNCPSSDLNSYSLNSLSQFSRKNLMGKVYLANPIKIIFYPPTY